MDALVVLPPALDPASFMRRDGGASVHQFGGDTMGTSWSVRVAAARVPDDLKSLIQNELGQIVAEMSNWEAASAISRFNRAPPGSWHSLPSRFFTVLQAALQQAETSGGAFDPTSGALVDAWGFGPTGLNELLTQDAIATALSRTGWRRIAIDPAARRARQPGGVSLDFSGIAKGYGVDRVAAVLHQAGLADFLVEVGGELRGAGIRPDGQPWWVRLDTPPGAVLPEIRIALHGLSVATSGDYRRFFERDGRRYSHSIDPRTGRPIAHDLASVSVLHPDCMTADALATALTVLGPTDGPAHAAAHDIAALFITRAVAGFEQCWSPAFATMLE
jgi:thiamine biosynthesis lipoprotein